MQEAAEGIVRVAVDDAVLVGLAYQLAGSIDRGFRGEPSGLVNPYDELGGAEHELRGHGAQNAILLSRRGLRGIPESRVGCRGKRCPERSQVGAGHRR